MKLSDGGAAIIQKWEGFRPKAYQDSGGRWTIGYGHTGTAKPGMTITQAEADRLFRVDVASAETAVKNYIRVPLKQYEFDALVSFTYNLGAGALQTSTLRSRLNKGEYEAVPYELMKWVHVGKTRIQGLVNRRADEGKLWRGGYETQSTTKPTNGINAKIKTELGKIETATAEIRRLLG